MTRPSGELIIAGQRFTIDAPIVNFTEGPNWDATPELCQPTATDPAPRCTSTRAPASTCRTASCRSARTRSATRCAPRLRALRQWLPPLEAVKAAIKQFVIHHDGCSSRRHVLLGAAERARAVACTS